MRTKHISQWIPAARALSSLATYRTTLPCPAAMVRGGGEWIHGAVRHEECATAGTADPRHDSGTYDGRSRGWMELCLRLYLHLHSLMVLPRLRTDPDLEIISFAKRRCRSRRRLCLSRFGLLLRSTAAHLQAVSVPPCLLITHMNAVVNL
ncbi:uncharacterized protein LOC133929729 isoform X2 [Phragmites australis]|uniref:uncharacterized protein LOC133929729 isoform X2 n=1 Tax=Phragmites australis TaxID=29695 RepID=UPI002D79D3C3|nr:uncharacterized protein LOC133929729 isoform X2 [Phragmites australis]